MELLQADLLSKSAKKKKSIDCQAVKQNKKISDFFKTPEKEVDKQKQRSLLQFFGKTEQETEEKSTKDHLTLIDEVNADVCEITTPTNSDKENNEVQEENRTVSDSKQKLRKQPEGKSSESGNITGNDFEGHKVNLSDNDSEMKLNKKRKKKRKSKEDRTGDGTCMSDSLIILSDNSLSHSETDGTEVKQCENCVLETQAPDGSKLLNSEPVTDKTVKNGKNKQLGITDKHSDGSKNVGGGLKDTSEIEKVYVAEAKMGKKKEKKSYKLQNNEVGQDCKISSKKSLEKVNSSSIHEKKKKVKKTSKLLETKAVKPELVIGFEKNVIDDRETIDVTDMVQNEKQINDSANEKSKSKKSTLKGKDMLNLLKEIQSVESGDAKKKKHKRKHKHNKIKETQKKDVLELAVSEDNSDGKEETVGKSDDKEVITRLTESGARADMNAFKKTADENNKNIEKDTCQGAEKGNSGRKRLVNDEKSDVNNKHTRKRLKDTTTVKKDKLKKKSLENNVAVKTDSLHNANNLSYQDFTDSLDKKASQIPENKKENSPKEMSYTEYLQRLENSNVDDNVETCFCDNKNIKEEKSSYDKNLSKKSVPTEENTVGDDLKFEKSSLKKFFSVMTSTPDHEKNRKSCKGAIDEKRKAVDKSELNKLITDTSQEIDCKVIDNETDLQKKEDTDNNKRKVDPKSEISKMAFPDKSAVSVKKTQGTLSFGKTGLTVLKPMSKSDEEESSKLCKNLDICNNQDSDKIEKKRVVTQGSSKKSKKVKVDLDSTDSSVFATPKCERKKQVKRKLEDGDSESAESGERRRSLRKRYKVEAFQMDADKKTPIKIKLKRCPKSSSSGEDSERSSLNVQKVKVNVKQSTAQALLEKAKRGKLKKHKVKNNKQKMDVMKKKDTKKKSKKRNESNSSEDSVTRRSSRLEGKVMASMEEVSLENIVISSSEDEGQDEKPRKRGRPKGSKNREKSPKKDLVEDTDVSKGTPKKDTLKTKASIPVKTKTPLKKSGMKVAPMFLIGKNKPAAPSPKKVVLDPETLKQRQAFLMSGVPEELRKQTATRIVVQADGNYPPIPRTSHVLQVPEGQELEKLSIPNIWNLRPVELSFCNFILPATISPSARFSGNLLTTNQNKSLRVDKFMDFEYHAPIPDEIVDLCLKEIASFNSTYPVTAMYKALKEMKTETEIPPPKSESMLKTDMKGILEGCTDMVVIDDEEDDDKKKKKKSLKSEKETKQNKEEPKIEDKPQSSGSSLLWTEKYCPAKTADVLGNSGVLKKLKAWLTEWKHVLDREARKARMLLMKKNRGKQLTSKKVDDDFWGDDSDFDLDSDDSDEDDSLCNTMLLTGPHGCGKTSSVYALALELGFKVHEVNASSCRSGKQILSQLQEATQSHQVSSQGNHTPRKNTGLGEKTKVENKMPTAFTNLFKKAVSANENKQEEKQAGKKRKRNASDKGGNHSSKSNKGEKKNSDTKHKSLQLMIEDSNSQSVAKSLNLSSTTLILFDEVDIVFEEDKGFLSAIQNFMSNTKIPILLTTADPGFTSTFEGRYEQMNFKRPSLASITTQLQTVSLVENVRTDPVLLTELAQFHNCDMRRCLLALQFLLKSGGGHRTTCKSIQTLPLTKNNAKILGLESENSQSSLPGDDCLTLNTGNKLNINEKSEVSRDIDNSDDDFVAIKPSKKRRRVLEDDSSNSVDARLQVTVPQPMEGKTAQESAEAKNHPAVHDVGLESLICCRELPFAESISQGLKIRSGSGLQDMICKCSCVKTTSDTDLFYNNLATVLPFSTTVVDSLVKVSTGCNKSNTRTRKRIKVHNDLYDSEASNDAVDEEKPDGKHELDGDERSAVTDDVNVVKGNRSENTCLAKSLSYFAKFYDTMSSLDVFESAGRMKLCDKMQNFSGREVKGTLLAGVENDLPGFRTHCEMDINTCREYSSEIQARSMCKLYNEASVVKEEMEKLCTENKTFSGNFVLPVRSQSEHLSLLDNSSVCASAEYRRACDNTVDNLPLMSQSHLRTLHLDSLPTLREICRTEQCRQLANTKRRFHHYLDNIALPLKDRTMSTLATTFI